MTKHFNINFVMPLLMKLSNHYKNFKKCEIKSNLIYTIRNIFSINLLFKYHYSLTNGSNHIFKILLSLTEKRRKEGRFSKSRVSEAILLFY